MAGRADDGGWRGSRWRAAVWGGAGLALLVPLAATRLTPEMNWGGADFAIFAAMLAGACGAFELAARATGSAAYRAAVGTALAAAFLLVWMNLAVGIIGTEGNPANLMFAGVLAVGIGGAVLARFRPQGMARASVAAAVAQGAVAAIALAIGAGSAAVLMLTGVFVALWLAAAELFRRAARGQGPAGATP